MQNKQCEDARPAGRANPILRRIGLFFYKHLSNFTFGVAAPGISSHTFYLTFPLRSKHFNKTRSILTRYTYVLSGERQGPNLIVEPLLSYHFQHLYAMTNTNADPIYTMGRSEGETDRLITQSLLYEGVTLRFFMEAGIGPGMKVLDIGSGAGDVSLALAGLVGPEGHVTGVDMNPQILETARGRAAAAGHEHVEFVAGDARTLDLGNDFDAVVGRLVLMYMADPADALKGFAARLRPGGIVAFQEADFTQYRTFESPDTPVMNQVKDWVIEVFERSGAATEMGFGLYRAFVDAGLPAPTMHYEALVGGDESWPGYPYAVQAFASFMPLFEQFGITTAEEVGLDTLGERLKQEVKASKRPLLLPPHVTAYARVG